MATEQKTTADGHARVQRTLLHIPLVHDPTIETAWLGSILPPRKEFVDDFLTHHAEYWNAIDKELRKRTFKQIYQEGVTQIFPWSRRRARQRTASRGSRNAQAICDLLNRGATLERTESSDEYLKHSASMMRGEYDLLASKRRDAFIGERITKTLRESGVLFLGGGHDPTPWIKEVAIERFDAPYQALLPHALALCEQHYEDANRFIHSELIRNQLRAGIRDIKDQIEKYDGKAA